MSVLSWQKDGAAMVAESAESLSSEAAANKATCTMSALAFRKIASISPVRKSKVLAIRQQVDEGTYDPDERLDAALDRLLEDLAT
jgi:anti-sigma28 factor (negative regulator of flagellin synthesis)